MDNHDKVHFEFSKITHNIYLGTNLCCTEKSHMQTLLDEDIHAEVDLESERALSPPKIDMYLWLPVDDEHAPSQQQINMGVNFIDEVIKQEGRVYVHCKYGHGRSPTLVAAYFVSRGASVDEAIARVKEKRPEIHINDRQTEALKNFHSTR